MYVYHKVEDELSACLKTKTPICIPKKPETLHLPLNTSDLASNS